MDIYSTYHTVIGYRMYNWFFFPTPPLDKRFSSKYTLKRAWTNRRLAGSTYFCGYAGRASPRAGHHAGPHRARSRQEGTVTEEANETVRLVSIKGPRSAECSRNPSPATRRLWVSLHQGMYDTRYQVPNSRPFMRCVPVERAYSARYHTRTATSMSRGSRNR